ncbi:MAG: hypothetical protein MJ178_06045 [Treponemataceae bacterium]|nr:hypothetical protein [Treponemataceae bacterium]
MKKTLKNLALLKKEALLSLVPEYDEQHREIIRMEVREDSGFLSPYADSHGAVISGEVAEFLNNAVKSKVLHSSLHLIIKSSAIDDVEKEQYRCAIKNYYRSEVIDADKRLVKNKWQVLWMCLAGIVVIAAGITSKLLGGSDLVAESIDIVGWVFLWESVQLQFMERPEIRREMKRAVALYGAEITYEE